MEYKDLIAKLESVNFEKCFPIYIPSHLRPNNIFYKEVVQCFPEWFRRKKVHYIVRDEMYRQYKTAMPDVDVITIDKAYEYPGYGLDTTRGFLYDYALENGDTRIFDFDDDNEAVSACFSHGENTRRLKVADRKKYAANIFTLASTVSAKAFKEHPKACYGTTGTVRPETCGKDFHNKMLWINKGQIPRQGMIINLKRLKKLNVKRNGDYDRHCEDIGNAFRVLMAGGWFFTLPTILRYTTPADEVKSPRTEPLLFHTTEDVLFKEAMEQLKKDGVKDEWIVWKTTSGYGGSERFRGPKGISWRGFIKDNPSFKQIEEEW